ncbi:hypothetical protein FACS1894184_08130 [Clostridia bacterium]|nr:hypothetical protein FACS1894184_08130 [Clostridia bacterium]
MLRGLILALLLDESGIIHDWDEHIGGDILSLAERDAKRRSSDAERQRRSRYNKKLKALDLPPLERGAPVPDTDPEKPCSNPVTPSRDCERDVYIDKEKDKELEGNDTVVAPAPVFICEDNQRARIYA